MFAVTGFFGGIAAVYYVVLSVRLMMLRASLDIPMGNGAVEYAIEICGNGGKATSPLPSNRFSPLHKLAWAQTKFVEFSLFYFLLMGTIESFNGSVFSEGLMVVISIVFLLGCLLYTEAGTIPEKPIQCGGVSVGTIGGVLIYLPIFLLGVFTFINAIDHW